MPDRELYTVQEVAKLLKVTERTVYSKAKSGELPYRKIGRVLRFTREDIEVYLEKIKVVNK